MNWLSIVLLAAAVSFDSLAIGLTYGLSGIAVPLFSRLILSLVSAAFLSVAMGIGAAAPDLSPHQASLLGGAILIVLGIYTLWRASTSKLRVENQSALKPSPPSEPYELLNLRIPYLNLIIRIVREPLAADYDSSKTISGYEALFLGTALGLDAFAAGFGAAILRFPPLLTIAAVIVANFIFLSKGLQAGITLEKRITGSPLRWLPGILIVLLGLLQMLT